MPAISPSRRGTEPLLPKPSDPTPAGTDDDRTIVRGAIEANRIDLYLQPIVTLPQRKVRYYEAMTRLRTEDGDAAAARRFPRRRPRPAA